MTEQYDLARKLKPICIRDIMYRMFPSSYILKISGTNNSYEGTANKIIKAVARQYGFMCDIVSDSILFSADDENKMESVKRVLSILGEEADYDILREYVKTDSFHKHMIDYKDESIVDAADSMVETFSDIELNSKGFNFSSALLNSGSTTLSLKAADDTEFINAIENEIISISKELFTFTPIIQSNESLMSFHKKTSSTLIQILFLIYKRNLRTAEVAKTKSKTISKLTYAQIIMMLQYNEKIIRLLKNRKTPE